MIKSSEMWYPLKRNIFTRQYKQWTVEATYVWNNQWQFDFIDAYSIHNKHLVTLPKNIEAENLDMAMLQCEQEMDLEATTQALEDYDEHKFDGLLESHKAFDSETVWIISIVFLLASMVFGVLWIFVYAFVRMCIFTFIAWIIIWIYAMSIKYDNYK